MGSLQTERAILSDYLNPLPKEIILDNYRWWFTGSVEGTVYEETTFLLDAGSVVGLFPTSFRNSILISISVTFLTILFGSLAAYAAARMPLRWPRHLMMVNLLSRMVPIFVLMIPLFVVLRNWGLLNSLIGIIITETGFYLPFAVIILASYFESLPHELEDAARVDGCTRLGALTRIILPLSTPGLIASAVIIFIFSWHELFIPLIVSPKTETMTLPLIMANLVRSYSVPYPSVMALCIIALIPTFFLALLLNKYVVRGLTAGALKG
ncbi:MAG: ABC transporter permease subunit [Anaerolineales bacterium]|nr:ABC transporter permease subunit [Anaerolineales bacterium]